MKTPTIVIFHYLPVVNTTVHILVKSGVLDQNCNSNNVLELQRFWENR